MNEKLPNWIFDCHIRSQIFEYATHHQCCQVYCFLHGHLDNYFPWTIKLKYMCHYIIFTIEFCEFKQCSNNQRGGNIKPLNIISMYSTRTVLSSHRTTCKWAGPFCYYFWHTQKKSGLSKPFFYFELALLSAYWRV